MNTRPTRMDGPLSVLRELKRSDPQTGLLTPRNAYEALLREVARSERYGNALSLLRIEVPALRDTATAGGDRFALDLASRLADNVRNIDYASHWAASEFLVVLPETDAAGARQCADKIEAGLRDVLRERNSAEDQINITIVEWQDGADASGLLDEAGLKS